ncbi:MAG: orotidine-5'-phosphate decarboxylase [Verrucomicrobia bacterium]|nr:orotidine-5'-phosphate decarboxylase [Verrucomicrobiota bacterium]
MKSQLIVALDVPDTDSVQRIVDLLPPEIAWYKVGLELFVSEGPQVLSLLKKRQKRIFLDLKLHDIPNTVARAVASAARHGADMLTLHAGGGRAMLQAAADQAAMLGPDGPKLVAVTTLTSLNDKDLNEMGISRALADHTKALGIMAVNSGVNGVVCSTHEAAEFRQDLPAGSIIVTPGIRPAGSDVGDQKRIATPSVAVKSGSDFLVVGRPILSAKSPGDSARCILKEIESAS